MSIKGLRIHSNVSNEHWILKDYNNDTQDKYSHENYKNILTKLNKENYFYYYWNLNDYNNFKPDSRKKCVKGNNIELLDEKSKHITNSLSNCMKNWNLSISSFGESFETSRLNRSLITLIRDSLFLNVYNTLNNSNHQGIHGFIISYNKDFNLYDYFLKFCQNAFWLPKKARKKISEFNPNYTYSVNLSDYSGPYGTNLCYFNRCYSATCCCERCTRVLDYLDLNHKDLLSSCNLKKLLLDEKYCLMEFLKHNKKYKTLEYKLLKISINGLLLKEYREKELNSNVNGFDSVPTKLFSSCFVLIKNLDLLFNQLSVNDKNPLNIGSLITDLLTEYTDLWDELSLPIFTFLFYKQETNTHTNEFVTHDLKCSYNLNYLSLLSNSRYFKYSTFISDDIINENSKLEYFQDLLNGYNLNKDSFDRNREVLRSLMRLTRGYSIEELKVLTRLAKCESLKDNCKDFKKEILKYFEKAVSLRPLVDFSRNFGLYPELSSFSSFLNINPLKIVNGHVVNKTGLESLVLPSETLEKIYRFLFQKLSKDSREFGDYSIGVVIKGDSGVGKTSLAHCLAQEMGSVFFSINILNFLRPEVGVSEKMLHSFLSTIRNHFSGSKTGVRKDLVRCVILLEGLESLNGREGYLKRIVFGLCKELDEFRSRCRYILDSSVLFITTCQSYSDIPERILKVFNDRLELHSIKMDENTAKKCFELFLNMRCNFIDGIDKLIEQIKKRNYLHLLTPVKIATISKDATLQTINEVSYLDEDSVYSGNIDYKERLVTLDTVISVMNSSFK